MGTDAVVDGTNPHGDTSVMLVVMRVKVDTPTLQDKADATSTEEWSLLLSNHTMTLNHSHKLDLSLSLLMHLQAPSVVTVKVSTIADHAVLVVLTTPYLLSDSVAKVDVTTSWSRTPGVPDGEPVVTSRWPVIWETTAVLPANLLTQLPNK